MRVTQEPTKITPRLYNLAAPATARLESVSLSLEVFDDDEARELTPEEWNRVVLQTPRIRMRGLSDLIVEHAAPDGNSFTVRDLARAVEATERESRGASEWFGGIDVHHVFFEGIHLENDDVWAIYWGS